MTRLTRWVARDDVPLHPPYSTSGGAASAEHAPAFPEEFVPQALHDRDERFAFLLGAHARGCSLDVLAELAPGDDEGNAGRAGIAGQPAATLDKVSLVLPGHPGQLDHEDSGPDLVDKPEITHLDCSTVARRRRKELPAGSMTFPLESKTLSSCRSASAWSATGRHPRSRPATVLAGAAET